MYYPPGRKESQPIVTVKPTVVKKLGEPAVDYGLLDELFREELGIDKSVIPTVHLQGRFKHSQSLGSHRPFSRSVKVNAVANEYRRAKKKNDPKHGTTGTLVHEAVHLRDSVNHRKRLVVETIVKGGVPIGVYSIADDVAQAIQYPNPSLFITGSVIIAGIAYYLLDPAEIRARSLGDNPEILKKYDTAITFPLYNAKNKK